MTEMHYKVFKNQSGQSLVQVLVAAGVMVTLAWAGIGTQVNMMRENRALTEKLAALEVQRAVTLALNDPQLCRYMMTTPAPLTFSPSAITPTAPVSVNINTPLISVLTPAPPYPVLAQIGSTPTTLASTLVVSGIRLMVTGGGGTTFAGNLVVDFDQTRLVRPIRGASVPVNLTVDASNRVTGCQGASAAGAGPGVGALCGFRIIHCAANAAGCTLGTVGLNDPGSPCEGVLLNPVIGPPDNQVQGVANCPSGYVGDTFVTSFWTEASTGLYGGAFGYAITCVKQ